MKVNKNYDLYDKLTKLDEDRVDSLNFLESLQYTTNSGMLMTNLNKLGEDGIKFEITKGFIFKGIIEDTEFNEFKTCIIRSDDEIEGYDFITKIIPGSSDSPCIYKVTI